MTTFQTALSGVFVRTSCAWAAVALCATLAACGDQGAEKAAAQPAAQQGAVSAGAATPALDLTDGQLQGIKVGAVGEMEFDDVKSTVGNIDFNQNLNVQVFSNYQGKITRIFVDVGDKVAAGKPLYEIESPDLMTAAQNLIGTSATFDVTNAALERAKVLYAAQGMAQKDYEQAISDQKTAEAAYSAARKAVRVFGKSDKDIDAMIRSHKVDSDLVVLSPVAGTVTARTAQPGLLVQPGNAPAPVSVAQVTSKWMMAYVPENDAPAFKTGLPVKVAVDAYPGKTFVGQIVVSGENVDPNTHRRMVRAEIKDPHDDLLPGMLTTFEARVGASMHSVAVPMNGAVREGDGTMNAWVTTDKHHFVQRQITLGKDQNGYHQVLNGLKPGELIAVDGAVLLSNMFKAGNST
ncbi:MAG: efflux RND transporter periplasmic adaptor subunit [Burkholderiaceae bacterium]|nr:efflux RND transporter periplasmic adaptor subunit [Burkholderiaceae bacterium]